MTLQEYRAWFSGRPGAEPIESEWLDICPLALVSGELGVIDPSVFEGETVEMSAGIYQAQARVMDWADDRRVSRLRVARCQEVRLGGQVGSVGVDFAQVGVVDWDAAQRAAESLDAEGEQEVIAGLDAPSWAASSAGAGRKGSLCHGFSLGSETGTSRSTNS